MVDLAVCMIVAGVGVGCFILGAYLVHDRDRIDEHQRWLDRLEDRVAELENGYAFDWDDEMEVDE